jgi:CRISPR-associated protein Cmr4
MKATHFYRIHCRTHLHVGSGDSNYGVIDKLVQRDPSDGLPCIFASSLKGAFREYFEEGPKKDTTKLLSDAIFGKRDSGSKTQYIFHDALLLSLPLRSNAKPFFNATCHAALNKLVKIAELYGVALDAELKSEIDGLKNVASNDVAIIFQDKQSGWVIEDFEAINKAEFVIVTKLPELIGENLVLLSDTDFYRICDDYSLPVIARNQLDNGVSNNLWYEQIVPRESKFFFVVNRYAEKEEFQSQVNNQCIQIGGNASVGYGQCEISTILTT